MNFDFEISKVVDIFFGLSGEFEISVLEITSVNCISFVEGACINLQCDCAAGYIKGDGHVCRKRKLVFTPETNGLGRKYVCVVWCMFHKTS